MVGHTLHSFIYQHVLGSYYELGLGFCAETDVTQTEPLHSSSEKYTIIVSIHW